MRIRVILSYIFLGLAMFQYQNCAPSNQSFDQVGQSIEGVVTGIDEISVGQISFPQSKVSADASENLSVLGLCEQSGAIISWKLVNENNEVVERGLADCDLGSFKVEPSSDMNDFCEQSLSLQAALGVDAASETKVQLRCD